MTAPAKAILITIIVLIVGGTLFLFSRNRLDNDTAPPSGNSTSTPSRDNGVNATSSMVRLTSPIPNAIIASPLMVTGEARGNWYFEASFPIKVLDANGTKLGQSYVQAQGNWMTTQFVPFSGTISYSTSTTPTGWLVLEKDNPSGLPEHAAEVRIPIRFNASSSVQSQFIDRQFSYDI